MAALFVGCFGLMLLCLGVLPLRDHTVWWELALGRWIEMFRAIPTQNTMTFGATSQAPLTLPFWLAHGASFWAYRTLGMIEGVLTARNVLGALSFACACAAGVIGRRETDPLPLWPLLLGGACVVGAASATSMMWALPLWALSLGAIKWILSARAHWMAAAGMAVLTGILVLWANLDVSWLILPCLCVLGAAAPAGCGWVRKAMVLGAGALGVGLAVLVHPLGVLALTHSIEILSLYPGQQDAGPGWAVIDVGALGWLWLVVVAYAASMVGRRWSEGRGQAVWYAVAVMAVAALAAVQVRAMAGLGLVVIAWWPTTGATGHGAMLDRVKTRWLWAGCLGCLVLGILAQPLLITRQMALAHLTPGDTRDRMPHQGLIPAHTPIEPIELLAAYRVTPRIWASPKFEGYIHLRLNMRRPEPITLGSPALELPTPQQRTLRDLVRTTPDLWRGVFQQYGVEAVVLEKGGVEDELIDQISRHQEWSVMYEDETMVYFLNSAPD